MIEEEITKIYPELKAMIAVLTNYNDTAIDLVHEVIHSFLEYPQEKQLKILSDGKLKEYLYVACKTQYNSSNSKYHANYRESQILNYTREINEEEIELEEFDTHNTDELALIMQGINKLCSKYEKQLIADRFIEMKTYKEMADRHNIPVHTVTNQIKQIINKLKNHILND